MTVASLIFDAPMVEAALFRSAGVPLSNYAFGPATDPNPAKDFRNYKAQGKGVGHVYIHVAEPGDGKSEWGQGLEKKSRFADHQTVIHVLVEALKHPTAKAALARLDQNEGTQEWLHGNSAIPVTGSWYGYAPNETVLRKVRTIAMNLRSHGSALFISSSYPEDFQVDPPAPAKVTVPVVTAPPKSWASVVKSK